MGQILKFFLSFSIYTTVVSPSADHQS